MEKNMKVGFIGLGNVGGKLANSLLRNGINLSVKDLDLKLMSSFKDAGAFVSKSPKEFAASAVATCDGLVSPPEFFNKFVTAKPPLPIYASPLPFEEVQTEMAVSKS